ncbi:hypothetical protein D1872_266570 [compost metagenome]
MLLERHGGIAQRKDDPAVYFLRRNFQFHRFFVDQHRLAVDCELDGSPLCGVVDQHDVRRFRVPDDVPRSFTRLHGLTGEISHQTNGNEYPPFSLHHFVLFIHRDFIPVNKHFSLIIEGEDHGLIKDVFQWFAAAFVFAFGIGRETSGSRNQAYGQ